MNGPRSDEACAGGRHRDVRPGGPIWTRPLATFKLAYDGQRLVTNRTRVFPERLEIMRLKRKRADQRSRSICLPPEDSLEAERNQLPFFEPYDTTTLLADAARANNGNATDAAIAEVYDQHRREQAVQLLRALGCDANDKQVWPKAFMKLAKLHHNVGRLVLRLGLRPNAKAWTVQDEAKFLCAVHASVQGGLSEREAVRTIADAKVFPYYERQSSQRPSGSASRTARRGRNRGGPTR
jgi:hypothetical protein